MVLFTDASDKAYGIALMQEVDLENGSTAFKLITFLAGTFGGAQESYSTIEKELMALKITFHKLNFYLEGNQVQVYTDHQPLVNCLCSTKGHEFNTKIL